MSFRSYRCRRRTTKSLCEITATWTTALLLVLFFVDSEIYEGVVEERKFVLVSPIEDEVP